MDKKIGRPHEGVRSDDGLDSNTEPTDTEAHDYKGGEGFGLPTPGTGGDFNPRTPSSGGELIDENDVQGHGLHGPGTGGDLSPRTPSSGGEFIDDNDVEGHVSLR